MDYNKRWVISMKTKWIALLCGMMMLLGGCRAVPVPSPQETPTVSPTIKTPDFVKAVWIPFMEVNELLSAGTVKEVETAIDECFEDCREKGFNTVYFHVRANSDAYYDSSVFTPHTKAAVLLEQGFDPLAYAVEKAHEKSLSLHAWVNPYRIGSDAAYAQNEDYFEYSGRYYYDPSSPQVQTLVTNGVRELVEGYDIDGVQFDDYFYPGGAVNDAAPADFEAARYEAYQTSGGTMSVADWRREQVSTLVADVFDVCHTRAGCVFGISPAYDIDNVTDTLYADVARWAKTAGYVDYLCPQLYFGFTHSSAPFMTILSAWQSLERDESVALYAGLGLYKTGLAEDTYAGVGKTEWANGGDIIARQLEVVRENRWDGAAIYSHQSFEVTDDREQSVVQAEVEALAAALCEESQ